jgi:hypothetical protein
MSRSLVVTDLAVLLLISGYSSGDAQNPYIAVYFCGFNAPWPSQQVCQGIGTLDTLCVYVHDLPCFISDIVFAIAYNPCVTWLVDSNTPPSTLGTTPSGVTIGWSTAQGTSAVFVCNVIFMWNCDVCEQECCRQRIQPIPHPLTGSMFARCHPFGDEVPLQGQAAYICAWTPVEQTTWGRVKVLYQE